MDLLRPLDYSRNSLISQLDVEITESGYLINPYAKWLAGQWQIPTTEFVLLQRGLLGGLGEGDEEQPFREYMAGRMDRSVAHPPDDSPSGSRSSTTKSLLWLWLFYEEKMVQVY